MKEANDQTLIDEIKQSDLEMEQSLEESVAESQMLIDEIEQRDLEMEKLPEEGVAQSQKRGRWMVDDRVASPGPQDKNADVDFDGDYSPAQMAAFHKHLMQYVGEVPNENTLAVLDILRQHTKQLEHLLRTNYKPPQTGSNDKFPGLFFSDADIDFLKSSGSDHKMGSEQETSDDEQQGGPSDADIMAMLETGVIAVDSRKVVPPKRPVFWFSDNVKYAAVIKAYSADEIAIYQNPLIAACPFIVRYHKHKMLSKHKVLLATRAVETLAKVRYDENIPYKIVIRNIASLFLNVSAALDCLHGAGYVHSDLSPNNIGFDSSDGLWKVFDFDHSAKIEYSLRTERTYGTERFRRQARGIVTPFDDYYSLAMVIEYAARFCIFHPKVLKVFEPLVKAITSSTTLESKGDWIVMAEKILARKDKPAPRKQIKIATRPVPIAV